MAPRCPGGNGTVAWALKGVLEATVGALKAQTLVVKKYLRATKEDPCSGRRFDNGARSCGTAAACTNDFIRSVDYQPKDV